MAGMLFPPVASFWERQRVFLTGNTGFKGAWLSIWLKELGAAVAGYSSDPPTTPSLFQTAALGDVLDRSVRGDIRDAKALERELEAFSPTIVMHLAGQSLVPASFADPVETVSVNAVGTAALLQACRSISSIRAVLVVTSDKCYKPHPSPRSEEDSLGGNDPYSASKACAEIIVSAFVASFYPVDRHNLHGVAVATARAGNVVGGGDWSHGRLVPDCLRAFEAGVPVRLERPNTVRPWQHVLEPLRGYLQLARALYERGTEFSGPWNFGPVAEDHRSVAYVADKLAELWPAAAPQSLVEAQFDVRGTPLTLESSKARRFLRWGQVWRLEEALERVVEWSHAIRNGVDMRTACSRQLGEYCAAAGLIE